MQENDVKSEKTEKSAPGGPVKRWPMLAVAAVIVAAVIAIVVVLALRGSTEEELVKTKIYIDAPATVAAGADLTAKVAIENVINFDSTNFDVTYDPSVLELTGIADGTVNMTAVPVLLWDFMPAGVQGTVGIVLNVPGVPGVNGSGFLCELHFTVIGDSGDTSNIDFSGDLWVSDSRAVRIDVPDGNWIGAVVSVE